METLSKYSAIMVSPRQLSIIVCWPYLASMPTHDLFIWTVTVSSLRRAQSNKSFGKDGPEGRQQDEGGGPGEGWELGTKVCIAKST